MKTLKVLNAKIEKLRDALLELLLYNLPACPEVIKYSQELDKLIVEYEKIILTQKRINLNKAS